MSRCNLLRLALPIALAATLLPAASFAQSQDSQSVAEAARRAHDQKKAPAKPSKVITDDDLKPATPASPDAPAAPSAPAQAAATAATADSAAAPGAPSASSSALPDAKDQKESAEVTALKLQVKQAQGELELAQREQALENDKFYSNTDYAHDTAGKARLEDLKQQVGSKQQEFDRLKARLAEMLPPQPAGAAPPPKS
jgi:hypothetical protein